MQLAWRTLLEDIDLMPKNQDFRFQPPSRLEAVAQRTDEEEGNCNHQPQSCSDSAAAVTPANGVFGSDTSPSSSPACSTPTFSKRTLLAGSRGQKYSEFRRLSRPEVQIDSGHVRLLDGNIGPSGEDAGGRAGRFGLADIVATGYYRLSARCVRRAA